MKDSPVYYNSSDFYCSLLFFYLLVYVYAYTYICFYVSGIPTFWKNNYCWDCKNNYNIQIPSSKNFS